MIPTSFFLTSLNETVRPTPLIYQVPLVAPNRFLTPWNINDGSFLPKSFYYHPLIHSFRKKGSRKKERKKRSAVTSIPYFPPPPPPPPPPIHPQPLGHAGNSELIMIKVFNYCSKYVTRGMPRCGRGVDGGGWVGGSVEGFPLS